ncbi:homing endonuclease associated repeat-containing protein [Leptospira weilii]|uniref:HNH endonuclease domain protein n=1 Tax=Leptospira weilii str. UI 13098 TaxID=1088542 RepID=M6QJ40_9LEPT|nr:HNH endonuclease [Leptospira weilii]EMN88902.1 HNH endonuclease domain protein [Leptospira weilii str. UI 13098]OMI14437.1 endonuclease [Leptospira weilii serovar Heyan]ULH26798.1 HNH endonuclease [Leptospira weilii]ULH26831.1 HNH endonuclease [Leptospira weilii]ULH30794.1 HNH endonuclease [Leptospira weilii]
MKFDLKLRNISASSKELIEDLKRVAKYLKRDSVTIEEYNLHGKYSAATLQRRFHSWFNVLEKANLNRTRSEFNISAEDLLNNIAEVWIKLGRQPVVKEMKTPLSKYGGTTYIRHFGTWNKALIAFIENVGGESKAIKKVKRTKVEKHVADKNSLAGNSRNISLRQRFSVFLRDGFRCQLCGNSPMIHPGTELHCDHIIPWSKGGLTVIENLRTTCAKCNLGKGNLIETSVWENSL